MVPNGALKDPLRIAEEELNQNKVRVRVCVTEIAFCIENMDAGCVRGAAL